MGGKKPPTSHGMLAVHMPWIRMSYRFSFPPKNRGFSRGQEISPKMDGPLDGAGNFLSLHNLIFCDNKIHSPPPKKKAHLWIWWIFRTGNVLFLFGYNEISSSITVEKFSLRNHFPMSLSHSSLGLLQKILSCWFRDAGFGCTNQNSSHELTISFRNA